MVQGRRRVPVTGCGVAFAWAMISWSGCAAPLQPSARVVEAQLEASRRVQGEQAAELRRLRLRLDSLEAEGRSARGRLEHEQELEAALQRVEALLLRFEALPASRCTSEESGAMARQEDRSPALGEDALALLLDQIRSDPERWLKPLTREQREAVRILLRPVRALDGRNPWNAPGWY